MLKANVTRLTRISGLKSCIIYFQMAVYCNFLRYLLHLVEQLKHTFSFVYIKYRCKTQVLDINLDHWYLVSIKMEILRVRSFEYNIQVGYKIMLGNILIIPIKVFPTFSPMFSMGFWGSGEIFCVFFRNLSSQDRQTLQEKNHRKNHETQKFDAKHSAYVQVT